MSFLVAKPESVLCKVSVCASKRTSALVYDIPKPRPDGPRALVLTPLELLDQIAALVPPPRVHRHRYYGVLAPNAPLIAAHERDFRVRDDGDARD
jgi:hypothetical protein